MIDFKPLRYFVTLAETLHFGRAAAQLHLTQPPLSRQLSVLEAALGVTLIERNSHSVVLTAAGLRFYADAKAILAALAQAEKNARAADQGVAGTLTIGFTMCAAYSVVPAYTRLFSTAFPEVQLKLRELISPDLAAEVVNGTIDAAIMFPVALQRDLLMRTVVTEPLCVALPRNHPLAQGGAVRIAQLAGETFVMSLREAAPTLRNAIEAHCHAAGFAPTVGIEVQMQQTILSLVNEGTGIALMPDSMRKVQLDNVVFLGLVDAPAIEQVLVWSPVSRNPCLAHFLALAGG